MEQQRDIAKKELERVITDSVTNKKKLETIKAQRQKDAKDLSAMRHLKDKAVQVMCVHTHPHTHSHTLTHTLTPCDIIDLIVYFPRGTIPLCDYFKHF